MEPSQAKAPRRSQPASSRRRYDSTGRQAQARENRARVIATATRLFVEQGYAGTSIAQVARAAGVSAPTVFAQVTSKANLLKVAVDVALAGDGEDVALHQRPQLRRVHEAPTAADALRHFAEVAADIAPRVFGLYNVVVGAADSDPEIAQLAREIDEQRYTGVGLVAATVADRLGLTDPATVTQLHDTVYALYSPQIYDLLVVHRGWSPDAYQTWLSRQALTALAPWT